MQNDTATQHLDAKTLQRFWSRVEKAEGCWLWSGTRGPYGHGAISINGRTKPAYRISFEIHNGPIPPGLVIDHICHNPPCVNPSHLRAVTHKQNIEHQRGANRSSKSGIRGVCWNKQRQRWHVHVKHNGVRVWGGGYVSIADAEKAAIALRNKLFTCNDADR